MGRYEEDLASKEIFPFDLDECPYCGDKIKSKFCRVCRREDNDRRYIPPFKPGFFGLIPAKGPTVPTLLSICCACDANILTYTKNGK